MAKLVNMPSLAIIDGFKGIVDYYVYMGLPCARRWPHSPGKKRAPDVEAQWPAWTNATRLWMQLSPFIQDAYKQLAAGTYISGYEWFIRGYISGIYHKEAPP